MRAGTRLRGFLHLAGVFHAAAVYQHMAVGTRKIGLMTQYIMQKTLATTVSCSGVGVHSGKQVNLTVKPAPANHGIRFTRVDLPSQPCIHARFNKVVDTSLATVIGSEGFIVSTIEHLMASFAGMSIDNALVEVDSYELPIMDGSAGPFSRMLKSAGHEAQETPRVFFIVQEPIELKVGNKFVGVYPSPCFQITYTIEYDHPLIQTQTHSVAITPNNFESEIADARTFGFLHEVEYLKRFGLAQGGSLENALVIDQKNVLNTDGLRFKDEFVRHKILDCIGDFSLLGLPLIGKVVAKRSGHNFNHAFMEKFFEQKNAWQTRTLQDDHSPTPTDLKRVAN
jgi:UDP-3-O-[3-hydroxymyristoyl] N-acetylglucosamine deacetylase